MRYFRLESKEKKITLYPLVCWHVGAPQSDYEFIEEMVRRVEEDPFARAIYLGDGGECVTKSSKGQIYEQTMNPQEQLNWLKSKLSRVQEKILFGVRGNHGHRTFKDSGLSFDESLMMSLQKPYFGTAAFWNLKIGRSSYTVYTHHGLDSGVSTGTKIMKAKKFEDIIIADAIISAHSHICTAIPPTRRAFLDTLDHQSDNPIKWISTYGYICGCAYDSRTGYAEDKGYPPLLPAHIAITFYGDHKRGKEQTYEIFNVDPNKKNQPNEQDKILRMTGGSVGCDRHPEYTAQRRPQVNCEQCWRLYTGKNP